MDEPTSESRLTSLEQRLSVIEQRLGIAATLYGGAGGATPHVPAASMPNPPASSVVAPPPPLPVVEISPEAPRFALAEPPITAARLNAFHAMTDLARAGARGERPETEKPLSMEQLIGLKWTGWVGALVLVVGVGLGIQFAYVHHWFAVISPIVRLGAIFAVGGILIGAGELVLRRVHSVPAASLFGAGVATLFTGAYAGYGFFDLYSPGTSLMLMGVASLVGALAAMRGNMVAVGALSIIGAGIAPLIASTPDSPLFLFLSYLLAVQAVALFLANWGSSARWWTLRGLSLGVIFCWMTAIMSGGYGHAAILLNFLLVSAVLYHTEVALTTVRRHGPVSGSPGRINGMGGESNIGAAFVLCVTAALALGILSYFDGATRATRTEWVGILAAASACCGLIFARIHGSLRVLGYSHRIAAVALLVLAVPIATSGHQTDVGWMLLAAAFAGISAFNGSRITRAAGSITWAIGLMHFLGGVILTARPFAAAPTVVPYGLNIGGTIIGPNIFVAWLFALCAVVIALLITWRRGSKDPGVWGTIGCVLSGASILIWIVASIAGLPVLSATVFIVIYAWVLAAVHFANSKLFLALYGVVLLGVATLKWIMFDAMTERNLSSWGAAPVVFNSMAATALLLAASILIFYRLAVARNLFAEVEQAAQSDHSSWQVVLAIALLVVLEAGGLEIDRAFSGAAARSQFFDPGLAEQVALSIYGALFAVAVLAAGFWKRMQILRYSSLSLLGVILLKVLVVDLNHVRYGYRVILFLALGLLLLGTSVMYGKVTARLSTDQTDAGSKHGTGPDA